MPRPVAISQPWSLSTTDFLRDTDIRADELVELLRPRGRGERSPEDYRIQACVVKSRVLMFEKPSLRTRCTFEIGIQRTWRPSDSI